ncbi:cbb3-type cytochrome c oxidase subunit 3 [Zavarzinia sp. CC-PAN008]|uniref:cbb3-type cytochrome c oxidase subunit 3 n=1 Tax=Zavarzinia sp. CC-PAN008 TaxID=3243332 RepID=UPI003F747B73
MTYDALRHFADSWGLVFMTGSFLALIGWTFRRKARADHARAATMIFDEERHDA